VRACGVVAARKVEHLLKAHARVRIVSPDLTPDLAVYRDLGRIEHRALLFSASQLDGAGVFKEMTRVVMPIVGPGMAAAALIVFIFAWNEYFLAFNLTANSARTLPPFLGSFVDARGQFLAALSAAGTLAVTPVVIAGWVAQKRLVQGLSLGALK
jgi:ABC-type glycerol-3-phosphate transport system permease component